MTMGIVCIVITGILWGCVGLMHSIVAKRRLNFPMYQSIVSLSAAAFSWIAITKWDAVTANEVSRTSELILVMSVSGALNVAAFLLAQQAMRGGHHAGTWTIAQSSLIFPFLVGVTVWGDPFTRPRAAGVSVILLGVSAFGLSRIAGHRAGREQLSSNHSSNWFTLATIAFFLLGIQQTLTQVPNHWAGWSDAGALRVPIIFTSIGLIYALAAAAKRKWPTRRELVLGLIGAAGASISQVCLFHGMDILATHDAGAIVYPLAISMCILTFAAYSVFILREPTNRFHYLGLACCLGGVILLIL